MNYLMYCLGIIFLSIHSIDAHCQSQLPIQNGLILDLDADHGIELSDRNRVTSWINQVKDFKAREFLAQDTGRTIAGSGRPTLIFNNLKIGGHNSLQFKRQELVNHDENAFDHLITGSGYTWFVVIAADQQVQGLKDVNSFIGNLKNGGKYEGFWGNFTDDGHPWMGSRNGITFGRWDVNNPMILAEKPLEKGEFNLLVGRMDAGMDTVQLDLFLNDTQLIASGTIPVNVNANSSKLSIGQERNAIQHPGVESFDGEITRVLIYERPLTMEEMKKVALELIASYQLEIRN